MSDVPDRRLRAFLHPAMQAELDEARRTAVALAAFAEHRTHCPKRGWPGSSWPCCCGLEAALARISNG